MSLNYPRHSQLTFLEVSSQVIVVFIAHKKNVKNIFHLHSLDGLSALIQKSIIVSNNSSKRNIIKKLTILKVSSQVIIIFIAHKKKMKLPTCSHWKGCHPTARANTHTVMVRTLSSTILVVADSSAVTDTPAKLKNAMLEMLPGRGNLRYFQIKLSKQKFSWF